MSKEKFNIILPDYNSFYMSIDKIFQEKIINGVENYPFFKNLNIQLKHTFLFISTLIYKKLYSQISEDDNHKKVNGNLIVSKSVEDLNYIDETLHYSSQLSTNEKFDVSSPNFIMENNLSTYIKQLNKEKKNIEPYGYDEKKKKENYNLEYLIEMNEFIDEFYKQYDVDFLNNINMFLNVDDGYNFDELMEMDKVDYINRLSENKNNKDDFSYETSYLNNFIIPNLRECIVTFSNEFENENGELSNSVNTRRLMYYDIVLKKKSGEFIYLVDYKFNEIFEFIFNKKPTKENLMSTNILKDKLDDEDEIDLFLEENSFELLKIIFKENSEYINNNFNIYYSFVLPYEFFSVYSYVVDMFSSDVMYYTSLGDNLLENEKDFMKFKKNDNNVNVVNSILNDIMIERGIFFDDIFFEIVDGSESVFNEINKMNHYDFDNNEVLNIFNNIIENKKR